MLEVSTVNIEDAEVNQLTSVWEEDVRVEHSSDSSITYDRLNHKDFLYRIVVRNPQNVQKVVIVRLWLGLLRDTNDLR